MLVRKREMEHFYHRKYSFRPILVVRTLSQLDVSECGKVFVADPLILMMIIVILFCLALKPSKAKTGD